MMKVISIWQPFASLIVEGCKIFETRTWSAPKSVIGQRIGIASTKTILAAQRSHVADEDFQRFYERTGLPDWLELPRGYLMGTAVIDSVELMTPEFMDSVSMEEQSYGWWEEGFYAWRLADPVKLQEPIPIRGMQGIYEWKGTLPNDTGDTVQEDEGESDQAGSRRSIRAAFIRRGLHAV